MRVRTANEADLPEIVRVYNQSVTCSTATFDIEPVTVEARRAWLTRFSDSDPLFVCESGSGIAGFAYYVPYRPKAGYAKTKELTIYVDTDHQGRGVGSRLMQQLIDHATERKVHVLLGVIADGNPASRALHDKFGFERVGCLREVGHKFGRWADTEFYQKILG